MCVLIVCRTRSCASTVHAGLCVAARTRPQVRLDSIIPQTAMRDFAGTWSHAPI